MNLSKDSFNNVHALVVGDVMLDRYWFGDVDRISPEAPVPVLAVKREEVRMGGAANVAHNLRALGAFARLLSVVGDDDAGRTVSSLVRKAGVEENLVVDASVKTIVKLRMVSQNQQLLRADFDEQPSNETLLRCLDDYEQALAESNVVVLSDYGKGGLTHVSQMIALAKKAGVPVIIDPKGDDYSRYRGATLITPNMKEFEAALGVKANSEREFRLQAHKLRSQLELDYLLVTRSERGMCLFGPNDSVTESPARALEVYDVSGAGDTVISLMALMMTTDYTDQERLDLANIVASIVVGKLGTAVANIDEVIANLAVNDTRLNVKP